MGANYQTGCCMPRTIKGFFFDLDGTLIDTEEANYQAYKQAINNVCGIKITKLQYRQTHGMVYSKFLPILIPNISLEEIEKISMKKKEIYRAQVHLTKPNIFLIEFLKRMADDYITVLVTTAKKDNAKIVLEKHKITELFDYMVFGDDVNNMKPNPEAYNIALKLCSLNEDEVIAFEDSSVGISAAHSAGISTIHIRSFL